MDKYKEDHPVEFIFDAMRNVINYGFIATPWAIIGFSFIAWNVVLNVYFNVFWAEGNVWLILNTIFGTG